MQGREDRGEEELWGSGHANRLTECLVLSSPKALSWSLLLFHGVLYCPLNLITEGLVSQVNLTCVCRMPSEPGCFLHNTHTVPGKKAAFNEHTFYILRELPVL